MNEPVGMRAKAPMMAVSLVLSFLLWAVIQITQPANVRYLRLPIQKFNDETLKGYVVGKLDKADIQITGPDDILSTAIDDINNKGVVSVYVDLTDAHAGTDDYPLHLSMARHDLPYTVSLMETSTTVKIEQKSTRTLPVTIDPTGQPANKDLVYDGASAQPSVVTVSGAIGAVRQVKKIRVLLDLSQVASSSILPATPEAIDDRDQPVQDVSVDPQTVKIAVGMAPAPQAKTVLVVPVMSGQPAIGFAVSDVTVTPNQVAVQGPPDILGKLTTISTRSFSLSNLRASTMYELPLQPPEGVKLYSAKTVRVRVTIEPQNTGASPTPNQTITGP